jgi:hypothetical protein
MILFGFVSGKLALLLIRLYLFEILICLQYSKRQLMFGREIIPFRGLLIVVWRVRRRRRFVRITALAFLAKQLEYHAFGFGVSRLRREFDCFFDKVFLSSRGLRNPRINTFPSTRILMTHYSLGDNSSRCYRIRTKSKQLRGERANTEADIGLNCPIECVG